MMRTISGQAISKIGIGSWGVGGRGHRNTDITDKKDDQIYIDSLVYVLKKKMNFLEISLGYGHGQSLNLFKQALDKSSIARKDLFITHSLYSNDLPSIDVLQKDIVQFYQIMETEYADSTLITQTVIINFGEHNIYPILHDLLEKKKTRYVSLSNASPDWIKRFKAEFGEKFVAHEGHLSFEVRALQDKGVLSTCKELNVENIIWRPLRKNQTARMNWPILIELSKKYDKTENQIILNWMCSLGFYPMVMSTNTQHIDENINSTNFVMTADDYSRMTEFRPRHYHPPPVDWESARMDGDIVRLANEFEKHITH